MNRRRNFVLTTRPHPPWNFFALKLMFITTKALLERNSPLTPSAIEVLFMWASVAIVSFGGKLLRYSRLRISDITEKLNLSTHTRNILVLE